MTTQENTNRVIVAPGEDPLDRREASNAIYALAVAAIGTLGMVVGITCYLLWNFPN